ncbi:Myosin 10A, isoform D, variant 3 [Chamberlinius hualienensis]
MPYMSSSAEPERLTALMSAPNERDKASKDVVNLAVRTTLCEMPKEYLRADEKYEDFTVASEIGSEEDTWSDVEIQQLVNYLRDLKTNQTLSRANINEQEQPTDNNRKCIRRKQVATTTTAVAANETCQKHDSKIKQSTKISSVYQMKDAFPNKVAVPHFQSHNSINLRNRLAATNPHSTPYNSNSFQHKTNICNNDRITCNTLSSGLTNGSTDIIYLPGPLTEDAVIKTLQSRFNKNEFITNVGPILLSINPYHDLGSHTTLTRTNNLASNSQIVQFVNEVHVQQSETGCPQTIILSGESGSGKTYRFMDILRNVFNVAGGGTETDAYKHLSAALTVLRSLGSAKTSENSESNRIGHFLEVHVMNRALYKTKLHCYCLDQTRVVKKRFDERNYHIFYQMLAGLKPEEKARLHLEGYSIHNLKYIKHKESHDKSEAYRFEIWRNCLSLLGILFMDVMRILAAILLIGNVEFVEGNGLEVEVKGHKEFKAAASLLGISSVNLFTALTTRTLKVHGQLMKTTCDATTSNATCHSLAKALYFRVVSVVVRKANSFRLSGSSCGTLSSRSSESTQYQNDVTSQKASIVDSNDQKNFIGILDLFGFENSKPSYLEQFCVNLCAETLQHFYNTCTFKRSNESGDEEEIITDVEIDYINNETAVNFLSIVRTSVLSLLDDECATSGSAESFVEKIRSYHKQNSKFLELNKSFSTDYSVFSIRHFAGNVVYDATDFIDTNNDTFPDDVVTVFDKKYCTFEFASCLFSNEVNTLSRNVPRGKVFRITTTDEGDPLLPTTFTNDFQKRLGHLVKTLTHTKPHFIRCLRINRSEIPLQFNREVVASQLRSLQVLETVNLMTAGFPNRLKLNEFSSRYGPLIAFKMWQNNDDLDNCKLIMEKFGKLVHENAGHQHVNYNWKFGKSYVFFNEASRQQLELIRTRKRNFSATLIQSTWRGWQFRCKWKVVKRALGQTSQQIKSTSSALIKKSDDVNITQLHTLHNNDCPPPLPPSRSYTVLGNAKLGYPQIRVMKMNYKDESSRGRVLVKGEAVVVLGASHIRGHLVVKHRSSTNIHVPYHMMKIKIASNRKELIYNIIEWNNL